MKKRTWVFCLMVVIILACAMIGCATPKPINESPAGNVINGDPRPDYDSMFDYKSGYVPIEDIDPNKMITLTLNESSSVKFAEGKDTLTVKTQTALTAEHFELPDFEDGRTLGGIAEVKRDGTFGSARSLETYRVPYYDTEITTYISPPEDFTWIEIGTSARFNYNNVPGSVTANKTIKYTADTIVAGGADGYPERGCNVTEMSKITESSAWRMDSKFPITANVVYEFKYNFENKGTNAIHLNVYQVNGQGEHNQVFTYEKHYRIDVDLEPGESMNATGQYKLSSNNSNALTYFVADGDMDNMVLGFSLSAKATKLTEPETVNTAEKHTLSIAEDTGVTFADGSLVAELLVGDPLPEFVNNKTGADIVGWYDTKNTNTVWKQTTFDLFDTPGSGWTGVPVANFTMPNKDITIAPFFVESGNMPFLAANSNFSHMPDEAQGERNIKQFYETDVGVQAGVGITYEGVAGIINCFRLQTTCAVTAGSHTFSYWIKNTGTETAKFTVYQVSTGTTKITGANSGEITLEPSESRRVSITATLGANTNAMAYFELNPDYINAKLGVVISKVL